MRGITRAISTEMKRHERFVSPSGSGERFAHIQLIVVTARPGYWLSVQRRYRRIGDFSGFESFWGLGFFLSACVQRI